MTEFVVDVNVEHAACGYRRVFVSAGSEQEAEQVALTAIRPTVPDREADDVIAWRAADLPSEFFDE